MTIAAIINILVVLSNSIEDTLNGYLNMSLMSPKCRGFTVFLGTRSERKKISN